MKLLTIMLILCVPVLNISLNTSIKNTAYNADTLISAIGSHGFLISFFIGMALMLCLLCLYSTGITLSRAILFMGAISILGGSLFGVLFFNETLNRIEWLLFSMLSVLLIYRFIFIK